MDPINGLIQVGLTEYEARGYLALLKQPDISGYEVSRLSGVPRSKVYETLEGLVRKGAATALTLDGKQTYQPLPYELLLARHESMTARVLADLSSSLGQLSAERSDSAITNLSGYDPVIQRAKELCRSADVRLLVAGLPAELEQLASELTSAEVRGVKVFVLSYGPCHVPLNNLIVHTVSPLQYLQVAVIGRWLGVVSDYREAMLVIAGAETETLGIWGSNKGLVHALSLWIQHDIQITEYAHFLGDEELGRIPAEVRSRLQEMILIEPEEMRGQDTIDHNIPADSLIREIIGRIASNPLVYKNARGEYGLILRGENGGAFTISVTPSGATLVEGVHNPNLLLRMDVSDFVSLVRGTLPLMAFMERNRLSVSGDLNLAGNLQLILRG